MRTLAYRAIHIDKNGLIDYNVVKLGKFLNEKHFINCLTMWSSYGDPNSWLYTPESVKSVPENAEVNENPGSFWNSGLYCEVHY